MVLVSGTPPGVSVHQLLCGRDIASGDDPVSQMAAQMANYVYVVVDTSAAGGGAAVLIDPCWDVDGLLRLCREHLGVQKVTAALFTHRHFDHTGGKLPRGLTGGREVVLPGLHSLAELSLPVAVGRDDHEAVSKQTGVDPARIRALDDGDRVQVSGQSDLELCVMTTPGHTTGSTCFRLQGSAFGAAPTLLFTGDTLFIGSCGRFDLPESNIRSLLQSLERLSKLPRETLVMPGHNYAQPTHSTIGAEQEMNDMMIQAMDVVKSGRISARPVGASIPLPDYLGVAEHMAKSFAVWDQVQTHDTQRERCCDHSHTHAISRVSDHGAGERERRQSRL